MSGKQKPLAPLQYGLIGYPLGHSFSPAYFAGKFEREGIKNVRYDLFPLTHISELEALLAERPDIAGLNVTIPYKQAVIPLLDELHGAALSLGSVNTIALRGGRRHGYNTDVAGFEQSLRRWPAFAEKQPRAALVLGTGGSAQAVGYVLDRLGIARLSVSRQAGPGQIGYADLDAALLAAHPLIINSTPLGMAPQAEAAPPLPYEAIGPGHLCYDLIYNPEKTVFLRRAEAQGAAIHNGLAMLHGQAEAAWAIWAEQL